MKMIEIKSKTVSPAALSAILGAGNSHELPDVRTPPEYVSAHVPGARLIPLDELRVEAFLLRRVWADLRAAEQPRLRLPRQQFRRRTLSTCNSSAS
jgi:hypothetical protein